MNLAVKQPNKCSYRAKKVNERNRATGRYCWSLLVFCAMADCCLLIENSRLRRTKMELDVG